ncbi:MAG: long-chain-fatty-acid--CoA ligase [Xanthobacteraceae bacterium]
MNITHGLRRALQVNPQGIAILEGERKSSWSDVGERVSRFAGALRQLGVAKGDRVAVLMLNSGRYLELYLAVGWAGAVIVPLNIRWSVAENRDALQDCGARLLIVDGAFLEAGRALAAPIPALTLVHADEGEPPADVTGYESLLAAANSIPDAMADRDDLAGIFYTGGTTGRSKGVMLSHGNLMADALQFLAEGLFSQEVVYLHAAPMFHQAAMYCMLLSAGTNAIIKAFSPEVVAHAIERYRVTHTLLVPTMIQMFVDHPGIGGRDLSSLRQIVYGASPISEALLDRAMKCLPGVRFVQTYGMTELSPGATVLMPEQHVGAGRAKGRHRSGGRAFLGVEVRIVDGDDRPVPPGTVGEIVVRGDVVMMGYWNRPEETAKAVIDGWMHTGDGGYMDEDGFVYVVDRIKDMIITGGENVYSTEVENVVAQYPGVVQCAVIGIPDSRWGEAVHVVVVVKAGTTVDAADLIAFCKERIAGYKCPHSVDVRTDPLPMSGAGKILKRELRRPFWEGQDRRVA